MAFTAYDNEQEVTLTPQIGEVTFNRFYWGEQPDGSVGFGRPNITSTHYCSEEELGLVNSTKPGLGKMFPTVKSQKGLVTFFKKKFLCIDPADAYIFGDFNSDEASLLNI